MIPHNIEEIHQRLTSAADRAEGAAAASMEALRDKYGVGDLDEAQRLLQSKKAEIASMEENLNKEWDEFAATNRDTLKDAGITI